MPKLSVERRLKLRSRATSKSSKTNLARSEVGLYLVWEEARFLAEQDLYMK